MESPDRIVAGLLPLLRQFCSGDYGLALGGSYAKGIQDEQSDIDLYLFAGRVLPCARRSAIIEPLLEDPGQVRSWGNDAEFVEGGTDFWYAGRKIECWLRNIASIEATLQQCEEGRINRACVVWTVMGFYNYVALSDIHKMHILEDPSGILERWQARVAVYPPALRQAILSQYLAEARFWPGNFHYRSAVERGDILYTSGIVQQVVYALVQVVFALNRAYFPGEKKVEVGLARLPLQPQAFYPRIRELVYPGDAGSLADLRAQAESLGALVREVGRLVESDC